MVQNDNGDLGQDEAEVVHGNDDPEQLETESETNSGSGGGHNQSGSKRCVP